MIRGVHMVRAERNGKLPVWYIYAWRGGPRIGRVESRTQPLLTHSQIAALKEHLDQRNAVDPTTLRSLIREWRSQNPDRPSSPEWEALADGTKKTWGYALDLIEEKWGEVPLSLWSDPRMTAKVVAWRDSRADTPRGADIGVGTLAPSSNLGACVAASHSMLLRIFRRCIETDSAPLLSGQMRIWSALPRPRNGWSGRM